MNTDFLSMDSMELTLAQLNQRSIVREAWISECPPVIQEEIINCIAEDMCFTALCLYELQVQKLLEGKYE